MLSEWPDRPQELGMPPWPGPKHHRPELEGRKVPMSTIAPTMPAVRGWMPSSPYRLTLEQYERMVDAGILNTRDRVHLIDGFLVAKMTRNDPHCTADDLVEAALQAL